MFQTTNMALSYRKTNFESRKQNEQQPPKSATQKMFEDFFRNNQALYIKRTPKTYVSPHKSKYRDQSLSRYRKHSSWRNSYSHDKIDSQKTNGCTIITLNLLLQTATTMNIFPVILELIRDQLFLIETLQMSISIFIQKKPTTNHKSNWWQFRRSFLSCSFRQYHDQWTFFGLL